LGLLAEVLDRGDDRHLHAGGHERHADGQIGDGAVLDIVAAHVHEHAAGALLDVVPGGLGFPVAPLLGGVGHRQTGPGRLLLVGEEVDHLRRKTSRRLGELGADHVQGRGERGVAVARLNRLDLADDLAGVVRRLADDPGRIVLHEQHAEAVARRRLLDLGEGKLTGALEERLPFGREIHAQGAVEDDDVVDARSRSDAGAAAFRPEVGPDGLRPGHDAGHGEDDKRDDGDAHEQQQKLFDPQPPRVLFLCRQEKAHRRPGDDAITPAIEQVNDDRHRDGAGTHGKRCFPQAEKREQHSH
jgi:hypothetical protein